VRPKHSRQVYYLPGKGALELFQRQCLLPTNNIFIQESTVGVGTLEHTQFTIIQEGKMADTFLSMLS
jgi:hypothetical protein